MFLKANKTFSENKAEKEHAKEGNSIGKQHNGGHLKYSKVFNTCRHRQILRCRLYYQLTIPNTNVSLSFSFLSFLSTHMFRVHEMNLFIPFLFFS